LTPPRAIARHSHSHPCQNFSSSPSTDDGLLSVSVMGKFLDELRLEFMSGDIDDAKVSSIDEALSVIRRALANALPSTMPKEGH
jgi:hypothetical protein